jgi:hypothetical protein
MTKVELVASVISLKDSIRELELAFKDSIKHINRLIEELPWEIEEIREEDDTETRT